MVGLAGSSASSGFGMLLMIVPLNLAFIFGLSSPLEKKSSKFLELL
jgi:preprotein translocase subunit YajC